MYSQVVVLKQKKIDDNDCDSTHEQSKWILLPGSQQKYTEDNLDSALNHHDWPEVDGEQHMHGWSNYLLPVRDEICLHNFIKADAEQKNSKRIR